MHLSVYSVFFEDCLTIADPYDVCITNSLINLGMDIGKLKLRQAFS